jgi:hypothetical protein
MNTLTKKPGGLYKPTGYTRYEKKDPLMQCN